MRRLYIKVDHLTFSLFQKLIPKFISVNDCISMVYKETDKIFHFLRKTELITV
ncbi:hypothetical protein D1AOALGA4SA_6875 [Olavius algarvensis Delta 1 endosymbiont]|nr:hypothetical protein D1AOALGA4SA_6875 [Olavius algarvensis Delta 1 endosymbiont]